MLELLRMKENMKEEKKNQGESIQKRVPIEEDATTKIHRQMHSNVRWMKIQEKKKYFDSWVSGSNL